MPSQSPGLHKNDGFIWQTNKVQGFLSVFVWLCVYTTFVRTRQDQTVLVITHTELWLYSRKVHHHSHAILYSWIIYLQSVNESARVTNRRSLQGQQDVQTVLQILQTNMSPTRLLALCFFPSLDRDTYAFAYVRTLLINIYTEKLWLMSAI